MSKNFPRQNSFRFKKLGTKWRRAKGGQSKTRLYIKSRAKQPLPGYGTARESRYTINGFLPVMIKNEKDFEKITEKHIGIFSSALGMKKVLQLAEKAKERDIKILNKKIIAKYQKAVASKKKRKELEKKQEETKKTQEAIEKAKEISKKEVSKELEKAVETKPKVEKKTAKEESVKKDKAPEVKE